MNKSEKLYKEAIKHIPAGVNSPVRAFASVSGSPLFISKGKGSKLYDADGRQYIDCVGSWGPLIFGHAYPAVINAVKKVLPKGTTFGAPTSLEIELAKLIKEAFPSIELVRMVSSGTEAAMSAIRLARGFTGREKIIKFEGCYHGHADSLLVKAGSGLITFGNPSSLGVTNGTARDTIVLPFNDIKKAEEVFLKEGGKIAAVIVEPIPGNMGVVKPEIEFLEGLRKLTKEYGSVLIFDEVISGFRAAYGGAQELYGIKPDLTCLGKIIGGGFPVGAFGGREEIMRCLSPRGGVYQGGTLSGNPVAMAAGIATLKLLKNKKIYRSLEQKGKYLENGLLKLIQDSRVNAVVNRMGSMLTLFFTGVSVVDYKSALTSDTDKYKTFFHEMLKHGIYLPPSQFEAWFISIAHTNDDLNKILAAAKGALGKIALDS